ncbi:uncharacterized protein LOC141719296 [Apium graveolens]|uniref:uncharacterized protein LOC141719296 n=1 Tax=Apium graveolens TaxID=4045 RepID=UPI003D7A1421
MIVVQGPKESLREYINRFTKEMLRIPDLEEKVAMIALQQGTKNGYFKISLAKRAPESLHQLQERAKKYIKAEESMKKIQESTENISNKKRKGVQEFDAKEKYQRSNKDEDSSPKKMSLGQRFTEYASLNTPRSQILMDIEKERDLRWPKPLRADPAKLHKSKYYCFHKDVGHDTGNCRHLKDEIEFLIKKGKLSRFTKDWERNGGRRDYEDKRGDPNDQGKNPQPRGSVINMIFGGPTTAGTTKNSKKAYAREVMHIVGEPSKRARTEVSISFDDSDLEEVKFLYDDPLVITPLIGNNKVK